MIRKDPLKIGEVYHIFTKSIAGFKIFNGKEDFSRMMGLIRYYQNGKTSLKFSYVMRTKSSEEQQHSIFPDKEARDLVEIIAYCIMPTHLHLILKQAQDRGISIYMSNILNGYTRYFNIKYHRKGPLWEGRFKNVLIKSDEQLLHLTRYIHLNPVTAELVDEPQHWPVSSYLEYLRDEGVKGSDESLCSYKDILDVEPITYKKFVEDRISYQRTLADIKNIIFE